MGNLKKIQIVEQEIEACINMPQHPAKHKDEFPFRSGEPVLYVCVTVWVCQPTQENA